MEQIDIFVIGGGINGTAIAADAAGRGLSVMLCEKNDLASATSSASTKLIHGGLRYLENYDFRLVKNALHEREVLMRRAEHLISPLEFVLPHESHLRPGWMIRLGLFFYDHLARRTLIPASGAINFKNDVRGTALQDDFVKGFFYYDCFTDDARLTVLNALSASENKAVILTRHEFMAAQTDATGWEIQIKNLSNDTLKTVRAKALINVAGPWVNEVEQKISGKTFPVKLVKGSHVVVPKLYEGDFAYILQNNDGRIVFAIPYQKQFTLIGTTDVKAANDFSHPAISTDETDYLCCIINKYFRQKISANQVIWSYSGVRCLQADSTENLSRLSREHKIELSEYHTHPLMTIIGGKLTTHRALAEDAVNRLNRFFKSMKPAWTSKKPLPGGDFPQQNFQQFFQHFCTEFAWLPQDIIYHYAKNYGTRAYQVLKNCRSLSDLGKSFTTFLYQNEVEYLLQHEWAKTADDILWRRTKAGLFISKEDKNTLANYCT